MTRTIIYISMFTYYFPITFRFASVLFQSECACLHKTVNMVVFFARMMKIPTQKGEHSSKCTELSFKRKEGILKEELW